MSRPREMRVLLVEDVREVVAYVQAALKGQDGVSLLPVLADAGRLGEQVEQLEPDVVLLDSLVRGRTSGVAAIDDLRGAGVMIPIIVLTVPQHPVAFEPDRLTKSLALPFSPGQLMTALRMVVAEHDATAPTSRVTVVLGAKGGVGRTTLAYNLAVALRGLGHRTALIDGSLHLGDLRRLLQVPPEAPSIYDLPTNQITVAELDRVMLRDPAGIDILLAPPLPDLAEMVNARDVRKMVEVLRRSYKTIVIDTPSAIDRVTLAFLEAADIALQVLTPEPMTLDSTLAVRNSLVKLGYPSARLRTLVNRADTEGGLARAQIEAVLGSKSTYWVRSDWSFVVQSNTEGIPFVEARPDAPVSQDVTRIAEDLGPLATR